jgi:hypothetical protein
METKKPAGSLRHVLVAALLLLGSMGTIAWLNPEIKDGTVSILPIKKLAFMLPGFDTVKVKTIKPKSAVFAAKAAYAKPKPDTVTARKRGIFGDNVVLKKLTADVEKQSKELEKYYNSAEYKGIEKQLELKSHTLDSIYKLPELKKLQDDMDQQSKALNKLTDNPEVKSIERKMELLNRDQYTYLNTPEYKRLQKNFDEQGKWFEKENASKSPDFQAHSDALKKAGEELRKYTGSDQFKNYNDQVKLYTEKLQGYYNSPEYKKQREAIDKINEEIRKAFNDQSIKQQQKELTALNKQLRDYNNSPEFKKQRELFDQAQARLQAYTNSPAFRKLYEETVKNIQAMNGSYTTQTDTVYK